jgi:hypothetical protein
MDIIFFIVVCVVLVMIFVRPQRIPETVLEVMRKKCIRKPPFHVFVDAGIDDPYRAMECVCRALDTADCPELINVYVIIPTSSFRKSSWETSLEAMCTAYPRYNTFFESSVHLYKMSALKYGSGGLHVVGTILGNLETIQDQDMVIWLPPLIKLEEGWDSAMVVDWTPDSMISYPMQQVPSLEQNIEGYLLRREIKSTPCYYFIDTSLQLGCRAQAKPEKIISNYASTFFPLSFTKTSMLQLTRTGTLDGINDDLEFSYKVFKSDLKLYVASKAIGSTYRKGVANPKQKLWHLWENDQNFKSWGEDIGLDFFPDTKSIKILLHGSMGTSKTPSLLDKITRWGTEVKYESFREELLFDEEEEKD